MAGTGYNIPISVSMAETFSLPQNTAAGTVFDFGPVGGNSGDVYSQEANPIAPATATSSAAEGNAASIPSENTQGQSQGSNGSALPSTSGSFLSSISTTDYLIIGATVLGAVVLFKKL